MVRSSPPDASLAPSPDPVLSEAPLPEGPFTLSAHANRPGYEEAHGSVVFAATGMPFEQATLFGMGPSRLGVPIDSASGEFLARRLRPGRIELAVFVDPLGVYALGAHELEPGEEHDLGSLEVPPPTIVELDWIASAPSPADPWEITTELEAIPPTEERVLLLTDGAPALKLLPGRYRIAPMKRLREGVSFEVPEAEFVVVTIGD